MGQSNQHRLLLIKRILMEETDSNHKVSVQEIIQKLKPSLPEMKMDARTIRADIKALDDISFSIHSEKGKFGKLLYSHNNRLFTSDELRFLIDAIFTSKFLPISEKRTMISRLKTLVSKPVANMLPDVLLEHYGTSWIFPRVQLHIGAIQNAITYSSKLNFQVVSNKDEGSKSIKGFAPYLITWQNDLCYLVGECSIEGSMKHYRVDEMTELNCIEEPFKRKYFDFQAYAERHFLTFSKQGEAAELRFRNSVYTKVVDTFGPAVAIDKDGDEHFTMTVHTQRLDVLKNWLLEWGADVEVLHPDHLRKAIKKEIARMQAIYND